MTSALSWFRDRLSLDLRSLAFARISLGVVILGDLVWRAQDLVAHYTDYGVLPRGALLEKFADPSHVSLHYMGGTVGIQMLLFFIAGFFAFQMILGYRTRFATIASWILLVSLQSRNIMILQGGDVLLRMMLFWAMFLPMGAYYSIDSALNNCDQPKPKTFFSVSSIAVYIQLSLMYAFSALYKTGPEWWGEGSAVYYALNLDHFATPIGKFLVNTAPLEFLKFLTYLVMSLEILAPFMLMGTSLKRNWRTLALLLLVAMHVGFAMGLEIGIFVWVCLAAFTFFIPSVFWDEILADLKSPKRKKLKIFYDADCPFCKKLAYMIKTFLLTPEVALREGQKDPKSYKLMKKHHSWVVWSSDGEAYFSFDAFIELVRHSPLLWFTAPVLALRPIRWVGNKIYSWVSHNRGTMGGLFSIFQFRHMHINRSLTGGLLAALLITYIVTWNMSDSKEFDAQVPVGTNWIGHMTQIGQQWNMFSPNPPKDDGWFVIPGVLRNGQEIDLFTGNTPPSYSKPELVSALYPRWRWRKYMRNLSNNDNQGYRMYYGKYLCRSWNDTHDASQQLMSFDMVFMKEITPPISSQTGEALITPELIEESLWEHRCF